MNRHSFGDVEIAVDIGVIESGARERIGHSRLQNDIVRW